MVSVSMMMHLCGLDDTGVKHVIQELLPCHEKILSVTGQKAPAALQQFEVCGQQRWCNNCEQALVMLSKCWHVPLMADVLTAVITVLELTISIFD